jgi:hypothetical protein
LDEREEIAKQDTAEEGYYDEALGEVVEDQTANLDYDLEKVFSFTYFTFPSLPLASQSSLSISQSPSLSLSLSSLSLPPPLPPLALTDLL